MKFKGSRGLLSLFIAFSLVLGLFPLSTANAEDVRTDGWTKDINRFRQIVLSTIFKAESHITLTKESFEQACDELISKIPTLDDSQLTYELVRTNAMLGVAHNGFGYPYSKYYPLAILQLDGDFYVYKTAQEYSRILNKKIVSIGGFKLDEAIEKLKPYLAFENKYWLEVLLMMRITDPMLFYYTGVTKTSDSCTLGLTDDSGQTFEMEIKSVDIKSKPVLIRDPESEKLLREKRPVSGLSIDAYYKAYIESSNTLYINYRSCMEMKGKPFASFMKEVDSVWQEKNPDRLIVDLRYNVGGNSMVVYPLVNWVKKNPTLSVPGKLFVLTGPTTMSSGVWAACEFLERTNAILVGEPTGGKPISWGNVKSEELEYSKLRYQYSLGYMRRIKMDYGDTLIPDVEIKWNHNDFFIAEDTVINQILADKIPIPERLLEIQKNRTAGWENDLDEIKARLMLNFPDINKSIDVKTLDENLENIKKTVSSSTNLNINLEICKLIAKLGNSCVLAKTDYSRGWSDYRMFLTFINDGLYVRTCFDINKEIVGKKIAGIGGLTIGQFIEKLRQYFCFEDGYRFICQWNEMIFQTNFLSALGLIGNDGTLRIDYEDSDGSIKEYAFKKPMQGVKLDMVGMFDNPKIPRYMIYRYDAFYEVIDSKLVYSRIDTGMIKMGDIDFANGIRDEMKKRGLKKILLDFRQNGRSVNGLYEHDRSWVYYNMIGAMVKENPGYSLTVAVDKLTNDNDVYMAWVLKNVYGATIVGQMPGIRPCSLWSRLPYTTTNNKISYYIPRAKWIGESTDQEWLKVDKEIKLSTKDFYDQKDPVVEWLLTGE